MLAGAATDIEHPANELARLCQAFEGRLGPANIPSGGSVGSVNGIEMVTRMYSTLPGEL